MQSNLQEGEIHYHPRKRFSKKIFWEVQAGTLLSIKAVVREMATATL